MEVLPINSWQEFDLCLGDYDGWAFRGHSNTAWPLLSSLSRYLMYFVPDKSLYKSLWRRRESRAMELFRRKAHNYISDLRILDDDLRCLALMQHHGAPTRLLDFTKSPYVAAFFALENATTDAAVFALDTPFLWGAIPKGGFSPLTRNQIDPRIPGNFKKYFLANKHELVWIGEPRQMDRRLLAQSGNFVVPGLLDKPVDEILNQYSPTKPLLKKIVFPAKIRKECMKSLYRMNITNATLFPGLDGLAKSMAGELEMDWIYDQINQRKA